MNLFLGTIAVFLTHYITGHRINPTSLSDNGLQMLDGHTLSVIYRSKTVNSKKILTPVSIPLASYKEKLLEYMQAE